ncbi:MAG: hypothetical protein LBM19_04210 [Holosporales bacterium]|nr:hypothetical protein [Holosporales bacterium]
MAGIRHPCTSVSTTSRRVTFDLPPEQAMKELTDAIRRLKEVIEGKYSRQVAVGIDTRAGYGWAESQYADILKCDGTPAGDKI